MGFEALEKKLGPVGMARFIQQFDLGEGDYTKKRMNWLKDLTINSIIKDIKKKNTLSNC